MEAEREGFVEPHAIGVSWRTRVSSEFGSAGGYGRTLSSTVTTLSD